MTADLSCEAPGRRGGRYPGWAPTVAVGQCADCAAMLTARSRRETRFTHFVRYAQTVSASQMKEARCARRRSARADRAAALLAAPQVAHPGYRPPRCNSSWCLSTKGTVVPAKPGVGVRRQRHMRRRGTEGSWPRAHSALRLLTRRDCPSATNAVSEASFATGRETEYRREPFAQRRAAASERRRIPARGFASMHSRQVAKRLSDSARERLTCRLSCRPKT